MIYSYILIYVEYELTIYQSCGIKAFYNHQLLTVDKIMH